MSVLIIVSFFRTLSERSSSIYPSSFPSSRAPWPPFACFSGLFLSGMLRWLLRAFLSSDSHVGSAAQLLGLFLTLLSPETGWIFPPHARVTSGRIWSGPPSYGREGSWGDRGDEGDPLRGGAATSLSDALGVCPPLKFGCVSYASSPPASREFLSRVESPHLY